MSQSYTTMFSSGHVANMVKEFVVDTKDEIASIDISQLLAGSRAFVIKDSQWYMLSNAREWEPVNWGSGGASGDIIYDGGEETEEGSTKEIVYDGGEET